MVVLNEKGHREVVDRLCEVLLEKTKEDEIEWSNPIFNNLSDDSELLILSLGGHKFEIMISYNSIGIEDTHITIYDESVEGGFMICYSMGNKDSLYNLSDYLFGKYIHVDDDTSATISDKLNSIVLDVMGRDKIREERLSKLLDKKSGFFRRMLNKITK